MGYVPDYADRGMCERALRLFAIYSRARTIGQMAGMLGTDRLKLYGWELSSTPGRGYRPSIRFVRRMMRLVVWDRKGILRIRDLDRVFWEDGFYRTVEGCGWKYHPERNPFRYGSGFETDASTGERRQVYSVHDMNANPFAEVSNELLGDIGSAAGDKYRKLDSFAKVGELIGAGIDLATDWYHPNPNSKSMSHRFHIRLLLLLLWDTMGIARVAELNDKDGIDWERGEMLWVRKERKDAVAFAVHCHEGHKWNGVLCMNPYRPHFDRESQGRAWGVRPRRPTSQSFVFQTDVRMARAWAQRQRRVRLEGGGKYRRRPWRKSIKPMPRKPNIYDRRRVGPDRIRFLPRGRYKG